MSRFPERLVTLELSAYLREIVAVHAAPETIRGPDTDDADLIARSPLLVYLHPRRWSRAIESEAFPHPEGFSR